MTYMDAYLKWTENTPSPILYHKFVALFLIGAAAHTNVTFREGHITLYPNLYVVLVSGPGTYKGVAMNIGKRMFKEDKDRKALCAPDRTTLPSLTSKLSRYQEAMRVIGKQVSGTRVVFSDELIDFLAVRDIGRLVFMNDMFDGLPEWSSETKTAGDDYIAKPCLCLLGCTTREMLDECLGRNGFISGFAGRTIFVSDEDAKFIPFLQKKTLDQEAYKVVQSTLMWVQTQRGEMAITQEAGDYYHKWQRGINEFRKEKIMDTSLQVLYTRLPLHVAKLAMIYALARQSMTIDIKDVVAASTLMSIIERSFERLYRSAGKNPDAGYRMALLDVLGTMGPQTLNNLYESSWHNIPAEHLNRIINGLINDGSIEEYFINGNYKGKATKIACFKLKEEEEKNEERNG